MFLESEVNEMTREMEMIAEKLPVGMRQAVKMLCAKKDIKIQSFIEKAINEALEKENGRISAKR